MIKAIETCWKGYRFRSRLEARWAVFFEDLGLKWEYEPEGFNLGETGYYLPDFYLPEIRNGTWIEVKADRDIGDDPTKKVCALSEMTGKHAMVVKGLPLDGMSEGCGGLSFDPPGSGDWSAYAMFFPDGGADCPYLFCICPWTGKVGIEYDGRSARISGWETTCKDEKEAFKVAVENMPYAKSRVWRIDDKIYNPDHPRLLAAADRARSARFEHGERPRVLA